MNHGLALWTYQTTRVPLLCSHAMHWLLARPCLRLAAVKEGLLHATRICRALLRVSESGQALKSPQDMLGAGSRSRTFQGRTLIEMWDSCEDVPDDLPGACSQVKPCAAIRLQSSRCLRGMAGRSAGRAQGQCALQVGSEAMSSHFPGAGSRQNSGTAANRTMNPLPPPAQDLPGAGSSAGGVQGQHELRDGPENVPGGLPGAGSQLKPYTETECRVSICLTAC